MNQKALLRTLTTIVLIAGACPAAAGVNFGVGAYGVYQWPIAQDDATGGGLFGVKGKFGFDGLPLLELEPNISWVLNGDGETDSGFTLPAPDVVAYQLNANLVFGGVFGLTGGLGWASIDLPQTGGQNKFATNFGLVLEVPVGPVSVDVSPRVLVINTESGASRKHGLLMAGLNYRF